MGCGGRVRPRRPPKFMPGRPSSFELAVIKSVGTLAHPADRDARLASRSEQLALSTDAPGTGNRRARRKGRWRPTSRESAVVEAVAEPYPAGERQRAEVVRGAVRLPIPSAPGLRPRPET